MPFHWQLLIFLPLVPGNQLPNFIPLSLPILVTSCKKTLTCGLQGLPSLTKLVFNICHFCSRIHWRTLCATMSSGCQEHVDNTCTQTISCWVTTASTVTLLDTSTDATDGTEVLWFSFSIFCALPACCLFINFLDFSKEATLLLPSLYFSTLILR